LEGGVLHPEPAMSLRDQQAAVGTEEHVGGPELAGPLRSRDGRPVLRDVVGGDADALGDLRENLSVLVGDHGADPSGAGIAAGRAVTRDDQLHPTRMRRQYSHRFTPWTFFRRAISIAESFWWQPWHTPSVSAAAPTPRFCRRRSS